jgi:hypothetical protein
MILTIIHLSTFQQSILYLISDNIPRLTKELEINLPSLSRVSNLFSERLLIFVCFREALRSH